MKSLLSLATSPLLAAPALAQQPVQVIIRTFKDPTTKQVIVVAHRADWRPEPENSIPAGLGQRFFFRKWSGSVGGHWS